MGRGQEAPPLATKGFLWAEEGPAWRGRVEYGQGGGDVEGLPPGPATDLRNTRGEKSVAGPRQVALAGRTRPSTLAPPRRRARK